MYTDLGIALFPRTYTMTCLMSSVALEGKELGTQSFVLESQPSKNLEF